MSCTVSEICGNFGGKMQIFLPLYLTPLFTGGSRGQSGHGPIWYVNGTCSPQSAKNFALDDRHWAGYSIYQAIAYACRITKPVVNEHIVRGQNGRRCVGGLLLNKGKGRWKIKDGREGREGGGEGRNRNEKRGGGKGKERAQLQLLDAPVSCRRNFSN